MHKIRGGGRERSAGAKGTIKKKKKKARNKSREGEKKGTEGRDSKTLKGSFVERESMKAERRSEFGMEHEH